MDENLLEQCDLYYELTGEIPHPAFIQSLPANYLTELAEWRQGIRFFEDMSKRPEGME